MKASFLITWYRRDAHIQHTLAHDTRNILSYHRNSINKMTNDLRCTNKFEQQRQIPPCTWASPLDDTARQTRTAGGKRKTATAVRVWELWVVVASLASAMPTYIWILMPLVRPAWQRRGWWSYRHRIANFRSDLLQLWTPGLPNPSRTTN
jgi:hypothetical protein